MTNNYYKFSGKADLPNNNSLELTLTITGNDCAQYMSEVLQLIKGDAGIEFVSENYNEIKTVNKE